uniref:Uncharacterized protein n=1 Tax=Nelumbo nucifera TaxID=4432 RepID=A0A822YNR3_NELNU|nr:TPA_asm: hypothetical protein HUJ06_011486 [Nelumbo nucifera]
MYENVNNIWRKSTSFSSFQIINVKAKYTTNTCMHVQMHKYIYLSIVE